MNSLIKSTSGLCHTDLLDLLQGRILALRISHFENQECCSKWQQDLITRGKLSRYSNATDVPVNRIGMTLFETENKAEKIFEYLEIGEKNISSIREIFGERNPLEKIIDGLEKSWNAGCQIQQMSQRQMNPGIIRSFEASANGGLPPHVDSLLKDLPDSNEFDNIKGQLAANLYFDISEKGGELEIWDYAPTETELESFFTGDYDFIDRNKIPVPSQKLSPKKGELILFRSNCIHSVASSEGGTRSAASCFIGFYGEEEPLTVWA